MATTLYTLPSLPCALPAVPTSEDIDLTTVANEAQDALSNLSSSVLFPDAIWRDTFALTGTLRTFYSATSILEAWNETSKTHHPCRIAVASTPPRLVALQKARWVEVAFTFETEGVPATTCSGFVSMAQAGDGRWKIWILKTILEGLQGCPNVDFLKPSSDIDVEGTRATSEDSALNDGQTGHARDNGSENTHKNGCTNGDDGVKNSDQRASASKNLKHYDCVVVGGGQAGLSTGGRLQALGASYVILDKHAEVGDNWKTRYDSTKLHTIREFGHLPFDRTFPDTYPEYLTKNDLATGYRAWSKKFGINISMSTTLTSGHWDSAKGTWTLRIANFGEESTITTPNIVFAVGVGSQVPVKPVYENEVNYKGIALHSGEYKNSTQWKGKHGVVVGTANTAHDIADDMLAAGLASVTMVQRTPTYVVPAEHYKATQIKTYNGITPIEEADRMYFSGPAVLGRIVSSTTLLGRAAEEPERFASLERAGFQLDKQGDMFYYLFQRFGGHYMDVGTSAKISKGLIKVKSDGLPTTWTDHGLICEDGSHLPADVVVFATGFVCNLKLQVSELLGSQVAESVGDLWGLDEEGEIRGAFKPCGHPAFWYHGGAVGQARYYARFIALQVKARLMGTPLPLYNGTRRTTKIVVL